MKILCPFHEEVTPSCHVYEDSFHCFGCGRSGPASAIPSLGRQEQLPKQIENIRASLDRISRYSKVDIRGLKLPCDGISYYVVWPDGNYYNRRFFDPGEGSKYKTPSGHKRPIFNARVELNERVAVIEGEINAMSVALTSLPIDIISPGAASEFHSRKMKDYLPSLLMYDEIHLFADEDEAGAIACIELKTLLVQNHSKVIIHLMKEDFNDILVKYGKEKVEEIVAEAMGLPRWVPNRSDSM